MNDCSNPNCPLRRKCAPKPPEKKEHLPLYDSLPQDDEEKRKQAVDRVPCGGGFRVLRRPKMLDSE